MNNDSLKILSRHYGCQCWIPLYSYRRKTPVICWPNVECIISIQRWRHQKFLLEFNDSISHCLTRAFAIGVHPYFHTCQHNLHLPKTTPQPLHGTWQTRNSRELISHGAGVTQRSTLPLWVVVYFHIWALCCSQKGRGVSSTHGGGRDATY